MFGEAGFQWERVLELGKLSALEGADVDVADNLVALELIEGGEELDFGDHSAADNGDAGLGGHVGFLTTVAFSSEHRM